MNKKNEKAMSLDALKEIVSIGTGQAATALSAMLNQKVMINVPDISLTPINKVAEQLGGANKPIIGVYFLSTGEFQSRILLLFEKETGHKLVSLLTGNETDTNTPLNSFDKSSIMELSNILTNSYLNAISKLLNIRLYPSIPYFAEDFLGAVIDFLLIEIAQVADYSLLLNTEMKIQSSDLHAHLVILPDEKFLNTLFNSLKLNKLIDQDE